MEIQNEVTFYRDETVLVTQSRYVTSSKTYAMRNISSVHTFEIVKSKTLPGILILIGFLMLFSEEMRIVGGVILFLGVLILLLMKNDYAVRISTNSGEANSIVSSDREYVEKVVNALNEAIIHRG